MVRTSSDLRKRSDSTIQTILTVLKRTQEKTGIINQKINIRFHRIPRIEISRILDNCLAPAPLIFVYIDMKKFLLLLLLLFAGLAFAMPEQAQRVKIGKATAVLEIADEQAEIVQGLSDRTELAPDHGMLFVFPDTSRRSFWMYHCNFDIDLAYVAPDGTIRETLTMYLEQYDTPPELLTVYPSKAADIQYVIEMPSGWFETHGVKAGQKADVTRFKSKVTDKTFK